jgi:pyruvate,water dikinase
VVGTIKATKLLKTGQVITVNGKSGEIFSGSLAPKKIEILKSETQVKRIIQTQKTATKVYVNLADPDIAEKVSSQNVDGVGLLRAEFIMAKIGKHPKKIIADRQQKQFIDKLSQGLESFCRAFNPRPVVYRTSDFKTNEYRNLAGGKAFEPEEENPFLGYRGAFRYINDEKVFDMELKAIKNIRNKLGFKNLWVMIPFVRTTEELIKVKRIIASHGLNRSPSFKLWMMVEIPANVILLDEFIKVGIDGISIGTNDLTMLILAADRDNDELASVLDPRNPAVLWALEKIIKTANKYKITSSICSQAPSIYPELTEKLVEWGISSVSVSPDAIDRTRNIIYQSEIKKAKKS